MNKHYYHGLNRYLYIFTFSEHCHSVLQVVNMVMLNWIFLLLNVFAFDNVLCENHIESFKAMAMIPSGHLVMEFIAQKADDSTLCQKHSQIYLNASSNAKGWAFQSK